MRLSEYFVGRPNQRLQETFFTDKQTERQEYFLQRQTSDFAQLHFHFPKNLPHREAQTSYTRPSHQMFSQHIKKLGQHGSVSYIFQRTHCREISRSQIRDKCNSESAF